MVFNIGVYGKFTHTFQKSKKSHWIKTIKTEVMTLMKLCKTAAVPMLLHGCNNWTLIKQN